MNSMISYGISKKKTIESVLAKGAHENLEPQHEDTELFGAKTVSPWFLYGCHYT